MASNLRYTEFASNIDIDAVYNELGWEPETSTDIEDKGYCLDLWGLHNNGDTTGKFAFNRDKLVYNCWVCGGGTLLSLVMEAKQMDYQTATNWLFGFTKPSDSTPEEFYAEIERMLEDPEVVEKPMPYFNARVLAPWVKETHPWFAERNISEDVREYFKCGFNPDAREYHPRDGSYEGPATVLPHFWGDKLIGWQHRFLSDDRPRWVSKYMNTSEFPRERTVWGYDFCKAQSHQPIIVESVPTALMLISEGYPAIATFGAQITDTQLKLLRIFQQGVILSPDNDAPGKKWAEDLVGYLERFIPVLVLPVVEGSGSDLGDLALSEIATHLKGATYP